jgi:hypothetical protein
MLVIIRPSARVRFIFQSQLRPQLALTGESGTWIGRGTPARERRDIEWEDKSKPRDGP